MSETVRVIVTSTVGSGVCVSSDDGQKVHDVVADILRAGKGAELSFEDVEDLTSAFLNVAVGQLYGEFTEDEIRANLSVVDIAPEDIQTLRRCVDRAKEYFKDRERFHAAAREALGDDDG